MNGVVIVAAGTGSRMKKDINKQFIKLNNKEIVAHTIEKFYNSENIDDIVVVIREDEEEYFNKNIDKNPRALIAIPNNAVFLLPSFLVIAGVHIPPIIPDTILIPVTTGI